MPTIKNLPHIGSAMINEMQKMLDWTLNYCNEQYFEKFKGWQNNNSELRQKIINWWSLIGYEYSLNKRGQEITKNKIRLEISNLEAEILQIPRGNIVEPSGIEVKRFLHAYWKEFKNVEKNEAADSRKKAEDEADLNAGKPKPKHDKSGNWLFNKSLFSGGHYGGGKRR